MNKIWLMIKKAPITIIGTTMALIVSVYAIGNEVLKIL